MAALLISHDQLQGYCRKSSDGWAYSPAAIDLLKDFMTQFPAMFRYLQDNPKEDKYYESELFSATEGWVCTCMHVHVHVCTCSGCIV